MKYIISVILLLSNLHSIEIPSLEPSANCASLQIEHVYDIKNGNKEKTLEVAYDNCKKVRAIVLDAQGKMLSSTWYDNDGLILLNNSMFNSYLLHKEIKKTYARKIYLEKNIEDIELSNEVKKDFEKLLGDYLSLDRNSSLQQDNIGISQYNFLIISIKYIQYLDTRGSFELSNILLTKNLILLKNSLKNSSSIYNYMMTIKVYDYFLRTIDFTKPKSIKNKRVRLLDIYTPFVDYNIEYILDKIFELDIKKMKQDIHLTKSKEEKLTLLSSFEKMHREYNQKFKWILKNKNFDIFLKKVKLEIETHDNESKIQNNIENFAKKSSLYFIKINGLLNIKKEYSTYNKVSNLYKKFQKNIKAESSKKKKKSYSK
jgi:hypothetical protein